ncbi:hypothetical protein GGF43_002430, partial [Coemansia sp. RSA 2618]
PLWEHIDDYAFPERVEKLKPAGRTAQDPRMAKEQPGSLLDILKSIALGIPRACASIGQEFFMNFHVPRAHIDTSVVSYPRAENTESAFETKHRRQFPKRKKQAVGVSAASAVSGASSSAGESEEDELASLFPPPSAATTRHTDSVRQMQFCLAPAQELPPTFVPRISEKDELPPTSGPPEKLAPLVIPSRGQPNQTPRIAAMQFQAYSSELPFGMQMNRRRTDFTQANMSYLPGVLDSTQFTYEHPGLYGDLPSLWLPVQQLKHRAELKRTATQRLKSAFHALESAFEDNVIGEHAAGKLHAKGKRVQRRVRDATRLTPFGTRQSPRPSIDSASIVSDHRQRSANVVVDDDDDISSIGDRPMGAISGAQVQQKMEEMMLRSRCTALGIDPAVVEQWDRLGLHRCASKVVVEPGSTDLLGLPADIGPILENDSLGQEPSIVDSPAMSASDSDFDDENPKNV